MLIHWFNGDDDQCRRRMRREGRDVRIDGRRELLLLKLLRKVSPRWMSEVT
jgi:hypothetical protein